MELEKAEGILSKGRFTRAMLSVFISLANFLRPYRSYTATLEQSTGGAYTLTGVVETIRGITPVITSDQIGITNLEFEDLDDEDAEIFPPNKVKCFLTNQDIDGNFGFCGLSMSRANSKNIKISNVDGENAYKDGFKVDIEIRVYY